MATIIINGRIGHAPEQKTSKAGNRYLDFSIATGSAKSETTWFRCTWLSPTSSIVPHLDKGSAVSVTGRLSKPTAYAKKDGSYDVNLSVMVSDISFLPTNKGPEEAKYAESASLQQFDLPF